MTLTFAFNYGGRAEITDGVREIAREVAAGRLDARQDRREDDRAATCTHPTCPTPTSWCARRGSSAISNYLLWESAYSEFVFTDVLWPDFRRRDLLRRDPEFQNRERRFGAIDAD